MQTKTKVLIGVGVAAVAGVVWFMRKKTGNQQPATNFSNQQPATNFNNQQPATALPVQIPGSPIVISEQTKQDIQNAFDRGIVAPFRPTVNQQPAPPPPAPVYNFPVDRGYTQEPVYQQPVYQPAPPAPVYNLPVDRSYTQEPIYAGGSGSGEVMYGRGTGIKRGYEFDEALYGLRGISYLLR
jgi:hypothetical protein